MFGFSSFLHLQLPPQVGQRRAELSLGMRRLGDCEKPNMAGSPQVKAAQRWDMVGQWDRVAETKRDEEEAGIGGEEEEKDEDNNNTKRAGKHVLRISRMVAPASFGRQTLLQHKDNLNAPVCLA